MAEQIGIVTQVDPGGWVRVLTDRKDACGGCHTDQGSGCRSCLAGSKFESRAVNAVGAQQGDLVKISLASKDFFKGAAMLYLMPVTALLIGALGGTWAAARFGWPVTASAILGAVAGLVLSVLVLIRLDRSPSMERRLTPTVVEVLASGPAALHANTSDHKCCA
jgi:sigma-E factor negative regulatory protein RseC